MKEPFVIKSISAYISVDPKNGDEGIIGAMTPSGEWMPFICADEKRSESLRPMAEKIAKESNIVVRHVRFSLREEIEVFGAPPVNEQEVK